MSRNANIYATAGGPAVLRPNMAEPRSRLTAAASRLMPMANLVPLLASVRADESIVCEVRTVDHRGRIQLSDSVAALGWSSGDRTVIRVPAAGVAEARVSDDGGAVLDGRHRLTLSRAVYFESGIRAGEQVLAVAAGDRLLVISLRAIASAVAAHLEGDSE